MIKYVEGNLLEALKTNAVQVIAHGCNCSNGFGSGIAKQIGRRYPNVRDAYGEYVSIHNSFLPPSNLLGKCLQVDTKDGTIINMFTQENYGHDGKVYCSYDAIKLGFESLKAQFGAFKIGIPKIGSGLGGGDWNKIESIINGVFSDTDIYVYVLKEKNA